MSHSDTFLEYRPDGIHLVIWDEDILVLPADKVVQYFMRKLVALPAHKVVQYLRKSVERHQAKP